MGHTQRRTPRDGGPQTQSETNSISMGIEGGKMTIEQLGWLVTTCIAIAGLILAIRKSKPDILSLNAKTTQIFQTMLQEEVVKGIAKDKTILGLEIRISTLEKEYDAICIENYQLKKQLKGTT